MQEHLGKFWKIFMTILGIIIGGVMVIFIGFFVYYSWQFKFGNSESIGEITKEFESKFSITSENSAQVFIENPLDYVRSHNPMQGSVEPKITIISFIDFECPYCQEQYSILKKVSEKYNLISKFVFKQLPLPSIHPYSYHAAIASTCAQEQNKFWQYHDKLFESKKLDDDGLYTTAQDIGLNIELFNSCFKEEKHQKNITQDNDDAIEIGVRGTPTHIINNEIVEGVLSLEDWDSFIIKHLKQ
ncbi:DsbA family protein [Candidatus Parcubacteria bacterium]|jgi:predicted DsbA family dithiol-disulfide isomerase|nr:DsbA family protein [Candidatus Parcubacteria bacterium]MBT3948929.1 DsbA family protein [Candidatus Parcubacteria bacterium]